MILSICHWALAGLQENFMPQAEKSNKWKFRFNATDRGSPVNQIIVQSVHFNHSSGEK
jgi:hypothetical protein